jgi:regulator of protease activity HflC (stomatin/prohibitin superfamily)
MLSPMIVLALIGISTVVFASIRRIPDGYAYTLRRFGGQMRTVGSGMHFVLPLIERVAHKISLAGNAVEVPDLLVPNSDRHLRGRVYIQVLDAARADSIVDQINQLVCQRLPELMAEPVDEDVGACNARLKLELNRQLCDQGLLVTRVQLEQHAA